MKFLLQAIMITEGDHLKLTCAASGIPKPLISWNRKDGHAIPDGSWRGKLYEIMLRTINV